MGRQKLPSDVSKQISSRAIRKKWVVSSIMSEGLDINRKKEDFLEGRHLLSLCRREQCPLTMRTSYPM